jgi:NADPH-dependent 2,4-dienoyl-CoA reductase/sulfur reductase-like enzyme
VGGGFRSTLILLAPQKIAYMADSYWKTTSKPLPSRSFITGMPTMFSVPHYSNALNAIRQEKGIDAEFHHNLVAIDSAKRVATFEVLAGDNKGKKVEKEFGMLHVTPPMGPRDWLKKSPIADAAGWVDVHQGTLQHNKFENIFSLGDSSSLPTSKVSVVTSLC